MLPEMTVEKSGRIATAHGLNPPHDFDSDELKKELWDMIELSQAAKCPSNVAKSVDGGRPQTFTFELWPVRVIEILTEYFPFDIPDEFSIPDLMLELGFESWHSCVCFVMDDNCDAFADRLLNYRQKNKIPHKNGRGFIDGDGVGFKDRYTSRLRRKGDKDGKGRGSLEKAFDAKYHFKLKRPVYLLAQLLGSMQAALSIINYPHPGHWSYPAGHGVKFFEAVDLARDEWDLSSKDDLVFLVSAAVLASARSGGVHYMSDNMASGYLAGLPEFSDYGK